MDATGDTMESNSTPRRFSMPVFMPTIYKDLRIVTNLVINVKDKAKSPQRDEMPPQNSIQVDNTAARCTFFLLTGLVSAGSTMILLVVILPAGCLVSAVILPAGRMVSAGCTMVLLVVIFPAGRLVSAGCTMVLLVVILPAGRMVSAGCTMVLLVVIFPAGRLVSAGCTMVLLEVIVPAGFFVPAGSYGLCCW
ncbi:hypothetical protein Tco_0707169 [Tanacetum coccineum]|uniref:Uncharacterized protein n=1 Tax=Tanacetum coccineum TaxID=301880 RepID=A0ABQ4YBM7_9ASTR